MLVGESSDQLRGESRLYILQFRHVEVLACRFHHFLLSFFEDLPKLDALAVAGQHLHVLALVPQPVNAGDFLLHVHAPQRVELLSVRLKLCVILVLKLFLLVALESLEDDDPSGLVTEAQELAGVVKFYYGNYIFLHNLLVGSLVAKKLGELVAASLAALVFVHSLFFYAFNILYELIKNDGLINTRPEQMRRYEKRRR